jgi:hypothetical protein
MLVTLAPSACRDRFEGAAATRPTRRSLLHRAFHLTIWSDFDFDA